MIHLGSSQQKHRRNFFQVISDTGTSWIGAPSSVVDAVAQQIGAQFDSYNQLYTVPCSTMKTKPDLVFTIDGVKYNIPSVEYILDIKLGNDKVGGKQWIGFLQFLHYAFSSARSLSLEWILVDSDPPGSSAIHGFVHIVTSTISARKGSVSQRLFMTSWSEVCELLCTTWTDVNKAMKQILVLRTHPVKLLQTGDTMILFNTSSFLHLNGLCQVGAVRRRSIALQLVRIIAQKCWKPTAAIVAIERSRTANLHCWPQKCNRLTQRIEVKHMWVEALPNKMLHYVYHSCFDIWYNACHIAIAIHVSGALTKQLTDW